MKKLVLILIIGLCAFPARAQWRTLSGWSAWHGLKKSAAAAPRVAENVERGVTRALAKTISPMATHIQITNLPGEPLVKLGTPLPVPEGMTVRRRFPVLPARMLSGKESDKVLFPEEGRTLSALYAPIALNTEKKFFFRGLVLYNLKSLQEILERGFEFAKVSPKYNGKIYFSGWLYRAALFVTEREPTEKAVLPTLIRFTVPSKDPVYGSTYWTGLDYYFSYWNMPAGYIQDVMVLLDVGGKPGWYKVTLENGKLVFTPAEGRLFRSYERISHEINIPDWKIDDPW